MPQTLADAVRAKYPDAYDDLSNQALEAAILSKYPGVYDDLPRSSAGTPLPAAATRGMMAPSTADEQLPARSLGQQVGDVGVGVMQGVGLGAASTIEGMGRLARRAIPALGRMEPGVPVSSPKGAAQSVGFLAEQGAEFAVPLSKISKATAGMSLGKRLGAEALGSAGVAGVQSGGDAGQMALAAVAPAAVRGVIAPIRGATRVARRAAAGATEGGLGGALAAAVRGVAPSEPRVMLTQALKPRSTRTNFPKALERAIPEIKAAEQTIGKPITGVDDLLVATKAAKADIQAQLNQLRGPQHAIGAEVDLTPVADAMERSIPKIVRFESPTAAKRLTAAANVYRRRTTLEEAETLLLETNAKLEGYYQKYPQAQRKALLSDPNVAAMESKATELRTAIYRQLDAPGQGNAARELNRRYGALMEVEGEAVRRANVAARQQPESLSEQIGMVRAAGQTARGAYRVFQGDLRGAADIAGAAAGRVAAKSIKESQTTDALIKRAFASFRGQRVPVAMPPPTKIRGLLPPGAIRAGGGPDPSFARGVPAMASRAERKALPAPARGMAAGPDRSGGRGVPARRTIQRDPRTGRMRRVYSSDGR